MHTDNNKNISGGILRTFLVGASALAISATAANAAGFYIQEQSVSAGGAAYSGAVSNTKDASTIYFNPAGMTALSGSQAQLGAQLLVPNADLKNTGTTQRGFAGITPVQLPATGGDGGNPYDPTPVPSGYMAYKLPNVDGLWAGLSITAPFGLANKYDSDWFGRYDSIKTELLTTDIQPTLAYKVLDNLSIGAGLNASHVQAELTSAVSNGVSEGLSTLEGDDWGYGYTVGVQWKPVQQTTLAANYKSSIHYDLDGSYGISGLVPALGGLTPAPNAYLPATASLVTPDIATFGLAHDLDDKWTVMAQASWFGWNNFDAITPIPKSGAVLGGIEQNYQTTWAYAAGAEYKWDDKWTLRGGVQFDETPTTDEYRTTRTPDGDRTWLSLGATYNVDEHFSIDMLATYIHIKDEDINVFRNTAAQPTVFSASSESQVGILGLAVNYKF